MIKRRKTPYILCLLPFIAACAPQHTETRVGGGVAIPVSQARFAENPTDLGAALARACTRSGDVYIPNGRDAGQCRRLPSPETAAALVLRYDGALEPPHIIIEHSTEASQDGFVVSISHFARVPQRNGPARRVYLQSSSLDRTIDRLFRVYGGEPI